MILETSEQLVGPVKKGDELGYAQGKAVLAPQNVTFSNISTEEEWGGGGGGLVVRY